MFCPVTCWQLARRDKYLRAVRCLLWGANECFLYTYRLSSAQPHARSSASITQNAFGFCLAAENVFSFRLVEENAFSFRVEVIDCGNRESAFLSVKNEEMLFSLAFNISPFCPDLFFPATRPKRERKTSTTKHTTHYI